MQFSPTSTDAVWPVAPGSGNASWVGDPFSSIRDVTVCPGAGAPNCCVKSGRLSTVNLSCMPSGGLFPTVQVPPDRLWLTEETNQNPTTLVFRHGEVVGRRMGAQTREQLEAWVDAIRTTAHATRAPDVHRDGGISLRLSRHTPQ